MLNGIAPVLIYNFKKNLYENYEGFKTSLEMVREENAPILPVLKESIQFVPIPIYLNENWTGLIVEGESKSIDIMTERTTTADGEEIEPEQKGLTSNVTITMICNRDNAVMMIISALADQIFNVATSREYSLSYISGFNTIFDGLLEEFTLDQSSDDTLVRIKMKISRKEPKKEKAEKKEPIVSVPYEGTTPPPRMGV